MINELSLFSGMIRMSFGKKEPSHKGYIDYSTVLIGILLGIVMTMALVAIARSLR